MLVASIPVVGSVDIAGIVGAVVMVVGAGVIAGIVGAVVMVVVGAGVPATWGHWTWA